MIQRTEHDNGVVTCQSPLLREAGVRHAFSTRIGGVSAPPYDTLNLGFLTKAATPDPNTSVSENFRRLRAAVGLERYWRAQVRQVHGRDVFQPKRPARLRDTPPADAMITDINGAMLTIRTADCVPVLMASWDGTCVAAIHAGWRGIVAGVVVQAVRKMADAYGIAAEDLVAAVGPCISAAHYEVDEPVAAEFERAELGEAVLRNGQAKPHIDLGRAVMLELTRSGVAESRIDGTDCCTYRDAGDFFSYRRDGGCTGRMAAVIAANAGPWPPRRYRRD